MYYIEKEVHKAENRIRSYIRETPLNHSMALSFETQAKVFLKCENLQLTGSFKIRGAMNKLLSLSESQKKQGIVTASSGNHGAAVAFGLNKLKIAGKIFLPKNASCKKSENIRQFHVPLEFYGTDCIETEVHALEYAKHQHMIYISPYNDCDIIAGQGTIGFELLKQIQKIDAVFVPIGGGGLISGIGGYLKSISSKIKIIGCLPENSPVMSESIKAKRIINMKILPTLSDATAGGIEANSITFDFCQKYVDDYILVSEEEIKNAIELINTQAFLIEGAAGVAVSAFKKHAKDFRNQVVVIILSGGNINLERLNPIKAQ